jgi:hypothetical protein
MEPDDSEDFGLFHALFSWPVVVSALSIVAAVAWVVWRIA